MIDKDSFWKDRIRLTDEQRLILFYLRFTGNAVLQDELHMDIFKKRDDCYITFQKYLPFMNDGNFNPAQMATLYLHNEEYTFDQMIKSLFPPCSLDEDDYKEHFSEINKAIDRMQYFSGTDTDEEFRAFLKKMFDEIKTIIFSS